MRYMYTAHLEPVDEPMHSVFKNERIMCIDAK